MEKIKLVEICNPKQWKTIPTEDLLDEGYPVYGANGVIGYYGEYNHEKPVVAITCRGATCGSINITSPQSYITGNAMCLDDVRDDIEIEYLYYCLKHYDFNGVISGSAQPQITRQGLNKVDITICSHEEQLEIIDRLKRVEAIIKLRKNELHELDELIKARFVEMFGDPFHSTRWPIKELMDVSESLVDGSNVNPDYYELNGEVLFLRIQNVWRNEFRLDDSVYISQEINQGQYYDTSLKTGDLLITKIGRYYTKDSSLGRVSVYRGDDDSANYSNNIMRVRLKETMNSEFVNILLNLDDYQSYIRRTSKGGTDKRALSKSLIGSYPIIIPPRELQEEFDQFVKQVDKSKLMLIM